ncbi:hypothetical protein D3C71_1934020 [compost metagenome]
MATSMPNTWAQSQTLSIVPRDMPMAARLHSEGRVLMAAGIQRANMGRTVQWQRADKKRACLGHQKALQEFHHLGEEPAQSAGLAGH